MRINDISVGDKVILRDTDSGHGDVVAELRTGGKSGGLEHDLFMAYISEVEDESGELPLIVTNRDEADEYNISL